MSVTSKNIFTFPLSKDRGPRGFPGAAGGISIPDAGDILTNLLTVDGAGSGLDADTLDGNHGAYFAPIASPTITGLLSVAGSGTGTAVNVGSFYTTGDGGQGLLLGMDTTNKFAYVKLNTSVGAYGWQIQKEDGSALATFLNNGLTGLGSIPRDKLTVSGGFIVNRPASNTTGGTNGLIGFGPTAATYSTLNTYMAGINEGANWYSGTALVFYTHAGPDTTIGVPTEKMRISKDGNIGIGVTTPANLLHVQKSVASDYVAYINNTNSTNGYGLKVATSANDATREAFIAQGGGGALIVYSNGKCKIGAGAAAEALDVTGTIIATGDVIAAYTP